ncbi:MAG: DUF4369 domain-containing protein, partial [Prevotella sp.]|nr:DUF4369 domain-containing protein [Prevotella sp.]
AFTVKGNITQAEDSVLYIEAFQAEGMQKLDSVTLGKDGDFSFSVDAPVNEPELYRLRVSNQFLTFSVDSTETITIKADYPTMATNYTVEGSENCAKIKELAVKQINLQSTIDKILKSSLPDTDANDSVKHILENYKEDILKNYIYKEPMKTYAYYALFQNINIGNSVLRVFDPRNVDDVKAFGAVATSWEQNYPESNKGKVLHEMALQGIVNKKQAETAEQGLVVDADKVTQTEIIDLNLLDNKGVRRSLTSLKGKVVLLDFHLFAADGSQERILELRELYNKYHDRGLEIYQVSLDDNEHFWKMQTDALPWISVKGDGSANVYLYDIDSLPVDYIINRSNQLVMGPREIKNLEADIARLL